MYTATRVAAVCVLAAVAACSVDPIKYTPITSITPILQEDCETVGDEDNNGLADCADPACAGTPSCQPVQITCGNAIVEPGEECDDGNAVNGDTCDANCTRPRCGNGAADPGEACDDGNAVNGDACDVNCTRPGCGNSALDPGEECDDAGIATARCDADCTLPRCGDGQLNLAAGEERDPLPSPSTIVPLNAQTCRFDFSAINQLYCAGACGAWGGGNGCQQADADAFCKLRTGNPNSTATSFSLGAANAAPGICCPTADPTTVGCTALGSFVDRGVLQPVAVHETSLVSTHGPGQVINNVMCSNP